MEASDGDAAVSTARLIPAVDDVNAAFELLIEALADASDRVNEEGASGR
jgi:hypothetical protein